jgi:ElaB/YqjD/DUF883 family membrane-anchored ribosome-binding protein
MSGTPGDTSGSMANEARDTAGKLLDAGGNVLNQASGNAASGSAGEVLDQVGDYVRQQPFSAALIALGIGYIIGRLRII